MMLPGYGAYVATKGAVEQFSHVLDKELGPKKITVNVVSPGPTDTAILSDAERTSDYIGTIPLQRLGTPPDIASAVWFLASPESSWTTGQILSPNGGVVI